MHGKAQRVDKTADRAYRAAIAQRVRDARLERDVSPYELGAATGLDASCIYKIERGEVRVLAQTLCRIAAAPPSANTTATSRATEPSSWHCATWRTR